MGREIVISRLDIVDSKLTIQEHTGYMCGRNEFTSALANYFYIKGVNYLVLGDFEKQHSTVYDEELNETINIDICGIRRNTVIDICSKYADIDCNYYKDLEEKLCSAKKARDNTSTLQDWNDFTDLIQDLKQEVNGFYSNAKVFLSDIYKVEKEIETLSIENAKHFVILILSE